MNSIFINKTVSLAEEKNPKFQFCPIDREIHNFLTRSITNERPRDDRAKAKAKAKEQE